MTFLLAFVARPRYSGMHCILSRVDRRQAAHARSGQVVRSDVVLVETSGECDDQNFLMRAFAHPPCRGVKKCAWDSLPVAARWTTVRAWRGYVFRDREPPSAQLSANSGRAQAIDCHDPAAVANIRLQFRTEWSHSGFALSAFFAATAPV